MKGEKTINNKREYVIKNTIISESLKTPKVNELTSELKIIFIYLYINIIYSIFIK